MITTLLTSYKQLKKYTVFDNQMISYVINNC